MGFFENMGNPQGKLGNFQLKSMNKEHTPVSLWGLKHLDIKPDDIILDIGCGGGMNVKRMAEKAKKVYGVDYSIVSVELSSEVNEDLIKQGQVEIVEGNVKSLPFEDNTFDIVTAFETVYFWPSIEDSFRQVWRVLKPGGRFVIVNEADGEEKGIKWDKVVDGMHTYNSAELQEHLINAGFADIEIIHDPKRHRLCVIAHKK